MIRPISTVLANQLFDILIETCETSNTGGRPRDRFLQWATEKGPSKEYRFCGMFGMAGKIWLEYASRHGESGVRITGLNHKEITAAHNGTELQYAVEEANSKISFLVRGWQVEHYDFDTEKFIDN